MTDKQTWESAKWLDALASYVPGDSYMYRPHGKVQYLGAATYSPTGEHVAIFRVAGVHHLVVTADDWADRSPMTMDEYEALPVEERG